VFLSLLNFEHAEFLSLLYFARAGLAHVNGFDLAATTAATSMDALWDIVLVLTYSV